MVFHAVCVDNDIQLVDGKTTHDGRVEICMDGRWGTVCDEDWGDEEARVVCTQLQLPAYGIHVHNELQGQFLPI